jgi:hypothetical protein
MEKAFGLLAFWCGRLLEGKRITEGKKIVEGKRVAKGELLASLKAKTLRKLKRQCKSGGKDFDAKEQLRENMGQSKSKERGFKE